MKDKECYIGTSCDSRIKYLPLYCYLVVVGKLECLNDPVGYTGGGFKLLVDLIKPGRLQVRGQTKGSTLINEEFYSKTL